MKCELCGQPYRRQPVDEGALPSYVCFDCWARGFVDKDTDRVWLNVRWGEGKKAITLKFAVLIVTSDERTVLFEDTNGTRGGLAFDQFIGGLQTA